MPLYLLRRPAMLFAALVLAALPAAAEDFTFLQFSDVHAPIPGSRQVIAAARDAGPIRLAPYNVTAGAPAFALVTGDLTEFGAGYWQTYESYWDGWKIPIYEVPGNHDETWWLLKPTLRRKHGGFPYAFDYGGCHFVALDSAGRQDPRPGFGLEELDWLRANLQGVKKETPLFLFFHHPLAGSEWSSPYDYERLLEILRPYNVALMLVGHGHSARTFRFGDYDAVEGGSTFDGGAKPPSAGNAGYNVICIQGGILRVAYRKAAEPEATVPLLEKPLAAPAPPAEARFLAPAAGARVAAGPVAVRLAFPNGEDVSGGVALDEAKPVPLAWAGGAWEAQVALQDAEPGVHVLRVRMQQGKRVTIATREFVLETPAAPHAKWRVFPGGSIRGALAVAGGRVYGGSQSGDVFALDAATGKLLWRFHTAGEVLGGPAVAGDEIYAASTDGFLYALDKEGKERWRCDGKAPFSAPPIVAGDVVALGSIDGAFHCIERATGKERWRTPAAGCSIEAAACAGPDCFYFGAWDTFVYCLSAADGSVRWKVPGEGPRVVKAARTYYSPADCAPVLAGNRLFVADRDMMLIMLDAATGERLGAANACCAVGPAADGKGVLLRRYGGGPARLTKLDADGTELWSCPVPLGSLPAAPIAETGLTAVTSNTGLVSAISDDGKVEWQYQAVPGFYVPGGATPAGGVIYVAGQDGSVSAVVAPGGSGGVAK